MASVAERETAIKNAAVEDIVELSRRFRPGLAQTALIEAYKKVIDDEARRESTTSVADHE